MGIDVYKTRCVLKISVLILGSESFFHGYIIAFSYIQLAFAYN